MRGTYTEGYYHFVWATWDRQPLLHGEVEAAVYACIRSACTELKAEVIAIGGVEDHLHLLAQLPASVSMAALMKQVKGASSHMITHKLGQDNFKWQGGYGGFTLAKGDVPRIQHYVLHQKEHRSQGTLDPELEGSSEI